MVIRHVQRATWIAGAIVAALLFFLGGAAVRLLMGPISLGPFAGAIEDSVNRSVSGLVIRFDQAVLEWSRAEGKVNLIVLGTKVLDLDGRIIAQAPKADVDFDAAALVGGHLSLKRLGLIGVQLTGVRSKDGTVHLGFTSDQGAPDILGTIRNILKNSANGAGSLQSFTIRDARLAFSDEPSGLFIVSPNATFTLEDNGGHLEALVDSSVEISGTPAHVSLRASLRDDGTPERGTLEVQGLSFAALAENSAAFQSLLPYRLVSDVAADFAFAEDGQIRSVGFHVNGAGVIEAPELNAPVKIDRFGIQGRYTGEGGRLLLDSFDIAGKQITGKMKAALVLAWNGSSLSTISGDINAENVKLVFPTWPKGLTLARVSFKGAFDPEQEKLVWQRLSVRDGSFGVDLSGTVIFTQGVSPSLKLLGTIEEIPVRDLLRYWPETVAGGAHLWIEESIPNGRIGPIRVAADFAAGMLDANALPNEALSLNFPFQGTTIRYMQDLTPLTGARGTVTVSGNSLHANVLGANVGPLVMTGGDVSLNDLHTRGAPGLIKAHGEGKVRDVLELIDQGPLGYPKKLGIQPASVGGQAAVDLDFAIPMRRDVALEEIRVGVQAKVSDLSLPLDPRRKLEGAKLTMDIDTNSLISQGAGIVSGVPVSFNWSESFASMSDSTRIDLASVVDERSRPMLGLTELDWVRGPMPFTARMTGRRFHFTQAAVKVDATDASADFRSVNLKKQVGVPASVSALMHFAEDGAISVADLAVLGDGIEVKGALELDSGGRLARALLSEVRSAPGNDFAAEIGTPAQGGLAVRIEGKSLDASRLFGDAMSSTAKNAPPPRAAAPTASDLRDPLSIKAKLDKLVLRDKFDLRDVNFAVSFSSNQRLDEFTLDAAGPVKGKITGRLVGTNGARSLTITADEAGSFIRGLSGFSSIGGGSLEARVSLPADAPANRRGAKPDSMQYAGTIALSNIVVTDQPFVARLFAAGSLDGPLRLLKGEGIPVTHFNAPFTVHDRVVAIRDGRFSGSAVGATFEGRLDRSTDKVDIAGTLVPVYGLNSMLGSVPVLGDLFVSKPGEGIFGLTYAMRGDLNEPTLIVNPLSVLTPGIFRRIFEFSTPKEASQAATTPAAKAE